MILRLQPAVCGGEPARTKLIASAIQSAPHWKIAEAAVHSKLQAIYRGAIVFSEQLGESGKMHLEQMKKEIESLVIEKGFYNKPEDIPKKLLFAFIELGEASDAWKKGAQEEEIAEELIDVIFYSLDASRLACPTINMDDMFKKKLDKNRNRPHQYGEGHRKK
jgi:NTP pyrophosphatase (non-canonical NTP hydrolase)